MEYLSISHRKVRKGNQQCRIKYRFPPFCLNIFLDVKNKNSHPCLPGHTKLKCTKHDVLSMRNANFAAFFHIS